jgi:DNA-binding NarL/FixJ family response regulator
MKNVHIIESHPVMRKSYVFLIGRQKDLAVSGVSASVAAIDGVLERTAPDLVVLGWTPHGPTAGALERFRARYPDLPLLVVSAGNVPDHARRIRAAGGRHLPRSRVLIDIVPCIRQMAAKTCSRVDVRGC